MGRNSTGVYTNSRCRKLDLSWMFKNGYIKKDSNVNGVLKWEDGSSASFESVFHEGDRYIRVSYSLTDRKGNDTYYDYRIYFDTVPSNLGKGDVVYFLCPESNERARILYMAYGHGKYAHRNFYYNNFGLRVYYTSQQTSKDWYANTRYFAVKRRYNRLIDELVAVKYRKTHYRGVPTKQFKKLFKLRDKLNEYDNKRNRLIIDKWSYLKSF